MRRFRIHLYDQEKDKRKVLIFPAEDEQVARAAIANWIIDRHWWRLVKIEEVAQR